jgi:hypothetical protein
VWSVKEAMYKWYSLGEIDFQQHLRINRIVGTPAGRGHVHAAFCKNDPIEMHLPYVTWENLVLTWVWM